MSKGFDSPSAVLFDATRLGEETPVWQIVQSEYLARCRVFDVRRDTSVDPRDARQHDFYVIEAPDWINVIPLTTDGKVIMIEQYRHGTGEVTLEIPGGMVDEGESPRDTALRELLEETGFRARTISLLQKTRPNPAIQNNWLHSFIAEDCTFHETPQFAGSEHTAVRLLDLDDVPGLIADGTIDHALVIVAFHELLSSKKQVSTCRSREA
jgi:ADP-ribose pyrophosphatase